VSGAAADPAVVTNGNTQTLTWSGAQLGNLATVGNVATVSYTATPRVGASLGTATPNTNAVSGAIADGSGAAADASGPYASSVATAQATIAAADLSLAKTATTTFVAGTSGNDYTLTVTNHGPDAAAAPVVTDTVPVGARWTFVSASGSGWNCTLAPTTITCTYGGSLASGATATIAVATAIPSDNGTASVTNTASVSSPTYDPVPANNTATVTTPVTVSADLAISKIHTGSFTAGGTGTWSVTVADHGPSDSPAGVVVSDTLPAGTTFASLVSAPGWSCTAVPGGTTFTCTSTGVLAAGANATFTYTVGISPSVAPGTVLTNTAAITTTPVPDPNPANDTTTDSVTAGTSADLSIVKTHAPGDTFTPGTDVTYTLAVANAGPSDAAAPVVTDTLSAGLLFLSASGAGWNCLGIVQTVSCTATAPLAANTAAGNITVVATVDPSYLGGPLANTATVSSTTPDPNPGNNTSTDLGPVPTASADLSITKTHTGDFTAGSQGTYTLTVTNNGPSDAEAPVVTDTLPTGLTYVSATGTGWTCGASGQTVTCTATGPLAAGATAGSITLVVQVASAALGSVANTASVSSPTFDPNPGNNTATNVATIVASADLAMTKTHDPSSSFTPGTQATYTLGVRNHGPSDAVAPVVTDTLPTGLTYVSATGTGWTCGASGQTVTCTATGPLVGNTTASPIQLVVTVASNYLGAAITNTASVTSTTPDPNPGNNTASDTAPVPGASADLSITKTHTGDFTAGSQGTYTLTVTNNGPSDAAAPRVVDTLPAGMTPVTAGGAGWACGPGPGTVTCDAAGPLAANTTAGPITVVVAVDPSVTAPSLTNTATVSSPTSDPNPGNNTASDPTTITTSADLAITKSHTGTLVIGDQVTYTLAVQNLGPSDAAAPTVTDTLPTGLTYVSATGTGWTCSAVGQAVTCDAAGTLAAGTSAGALSVVATVGAAAYPSVTNTATVTSTTSDPNPGNNTASDPGTVAPLADLSITKTVASPPPYDVGTQVVYDLTVANAGPTEDPGPVVATDTLPTGLTYVSGTGTGWTCVAVGQTVTCTLAGPLADGASSTIALTVALGAAAAPSVANTATVQGSPDDPHPANNSSTVTTTVTPVAVLHLSKALSSPALVVGQNATYTMTVASTGPSAADGVIVHDQLPAALTYVSGSGGGWTCSADGQLVTCALAGSLADGATSSVPVVVHVGPSAAPVANGATLGATTTIGSGSVTTAATVASVVVLPPPPGPDGAAPVPELAWTGADIVDVAGVGAALGMAGLLLLRRRRRA